MPFQILLEFPLSHADSLTPAIHPFEHRVSHLEVKLLQTPEVATDAKIAVCPVSLAFRTGHQSLSGRCLLTRLSHSLISLIFRCMFCFEVLCPITKYPRRRVP